MPPSPFLKALKELGQHLGRKLDAISAAVQAAKPAKEDGSSRQLQAALLRLEQAVKKIQKPEFSGKLTVDGQPFAREIRGIAGEIKQLSAKLKPADTTKLENELIALCRAIDKQPWDSVIGALGGVKAAIEASAFNPKKGMTVKLDEMQLRQMSRGGGTTVVRGGGEQLLARQVANTVLTLTNANEEYSYTFPANTLMWRLKARAQNAKVLYSWAEGTLPTSGDGSAYMTLPANFLDSRQGVDFSGKTIYVQSETAGAVLEIETYRA